ncbi:GNAT family N-acetyltransferase [Saccharothrix algeriensis]|uniref:GNAT family N-acetyltransferase n=1 Tax=Saccharothrix algeriensis TaxID=173560 RepID=A0A8T8HTI1_9PSEU|nr:GNAT family N-acyltransferase [Saccharothrix algeriensis]MBM7813260.1 putative hemolysin [Saccharothrix algeriensis]QTR01816.1 GNAT family N-acetyltransferase [Saccharothrix algeriensis]
MTQPQLLVSTGETAAADAPRYSLLVARDSAEVVAAQKLRHQVFAGEMGATLHSPIAGHDVDAFDEHCDHLVVRDDRTGEIVGTYRMLPPDRAAAAGRLYSDTEFDLANLADLRPSVVETGRSCVHPDHRNGAVVSLVWAGIARYMLLSGHSWLVGCASVPLHEGGSYAAGVWDQVRAKHYAPERYRVTPLRPWDVDAAPRPAKAVLPPLLKGYLRLGAWVCGRPALDPDFGVADLLVLLGMEHVDQRYLKFFLGETS